MTAEEGVLDCIMMPVLKTSPIPFVSEKSNSPISRVYCFLYTVVSEAAFADVRHTYLYWSIFIIACEFLIIT